MSSVAGKKAPLCKAQNLFEHLKSQSPSVLEQLYGHPATCLAIFRDLPELAKHYIMRLLFVESAVPQAVVASWVNKQSARYVVFSFEMFICKQMSISIDSEHDKAVDALNSLKIWAETPMPGGLPGWLIVKTFRLNLKIALLGG